MHLSVNVEIKPKLNFNLWFNVGSKGVTCKMCDGLGEQIIFLKKIYRIKWKKGENFINSCSSEQLWNTITSYVAMEHSYNCCISVVSIIN